MSLSLLVGTTVDDKCLKKQVRGDHRVKLFLKAGKLMNHSGGMEVIALSC